MRSADVRSERTIPIYGASIEPVTLILIFDREPHAFLGSIMDSTDCGRRECLARVEEMSSSLARSRPPVAIARREHDEQAPDEK